MNRDRDEHLGRYEATGDETAFGGAKTRSEQALAESPEDADLHTRVRIDPPSDNDADDAG